MHTSPAGMTYQWYYHLVQYVRVYVPCGTMVPPVLYHGTYGRLPWYYSTMAIHQLPVATVQAALLEVQAGAFSGGEAREHGCETANDACAHTQPRVVENTLGSGGGGGGGGLHRTAIGSVVVREFLSPIVVRVRTRVPPWYRLQRLVFKQNRRGTSGC